MGGIRYRGRGEWKRWGRGTGEGRGGVRQCRGGGWGGVREGVQEGVEKELGMGRWRARER